MVFVLGGVRGAALIWSPLLEKPFRVANQMMQVVDWLPTLLEAAGAKTMYVSKKKANNIFF